MAQQHPAERDLRGQRLHVHRSNQRLTHPSTHRWPRPALIGAGLVVAALITGAFIDHAVTEDALPEIRDFSTAPQADLSEREDLLDDFELRAWLYSLGIVLATGALVAIALRSAAPDQRRDLFRDLGVAGVIFLFAGLYLMSREPYLLADSSSEGVYGLPGVAMVVAAAIGAIACRDRSASGGMQQELADWPWVSKGAIGLAALTVLLVIAGHADRDCGDASEVSDALLAAAFFASVLAAACGIVSLFKRRWLAALVAIPAPLLAVVSLVAAACLE